MDFSKKSLGVVVFFCGLLSSVFALGAGKSCVGNKLVNIVIIADAFQEEEALRNYELSETMQKRSGEWRFHRVRSEEDIQDAMRLGKGECINTMVVAGLHTSWEDGELKAAVRYGEGGHLVYRPIDLDMAFQPRCTAPLTGFGMGFATQAPAQIQCESSDPKFAEGALVAFNSCHLVPEENPDAMFKRLSSVLKLSNGSIYANYTYGVAHPANLLAVPCYEGSQGGLVKSIRTIFQAAWPLTLAANSAAYSLQNKGYLASVNGDEISYKDSRFQDAVKTPDK